MSLHSGCGDFVVAVIVVVVVVVVVVNVSPAIEHLALVTTCSKRVAKAVVLP